MTVILVCVQFVPNVWHAALCLGLMVALAPSLSLHPRSHWIYALLGTLLITGMSLTAVIHNVANSLLPILGITAVYPSVIYYAHWQVRSASALKERSELLSSMGQLAGSVAHDFNNTLMSISGHAELAILELPDQHVARDSLDNVVDAATRASLLSRHLLAFAGRGVTADGRLNLHDELQTITALLAPVVPKGVSIQFTSNTESVWIQFDRAELQQVLMNVILNAGEAMRGKPEVIRVMLHHNQQTRDWVEITISDTGSGIAETNLPNIFDPYFTSKEQGHGLGLATAKNIMLKHGGEISMTSKVDQGTAVSLKLRTIAAPATATASPAPNRLDQAGHALVVDDEHGVLSATSRYLQTLHFDVVRATDAKTALAEYRSYNKESNAHFAIVILDLNLPGRNGWELLNDIRTINPHQPVIICSGYDPSGQGHVAEHANVTYLTKPYRLQALQTAINEVLAEATI
ncbi:MAG: ATP-binding protein [Pseudomonadota bacterium]